MAALIRSKMTSPSSATAYWDERAISGLYALHAYLEKKEGGFRPKRRRAGGAK